MGRCRGKKKRSKGRGISAIETKALVRSEPKKGNNERLSEKRQLEGSCPYNGRTGADLRSLKPLSLLVFCFAICADGAVITCLIGQLVKKRFLLRETKLDQWGLSFKVHFSLQ